jgi:aminopeptidase N
MDEGFNTFINSLSVEAFNKGEYNLETFGALDLYRFLYNSESQTALLAPDVMKEANIGAALYYKPAYALTLLRKHILGPERFDYAFKTYINRWAYKHPSPNDFFRTMENVAGEDLGWFWRGMILENYRLDQRLAKVEYQDNDASKGAIITIENMDQMAMPVILVYETVSGKVGKSEFPAEIWQNGAEWSTYLPTKEKLKTVVIDPEHVYPDLNQGNNVWEGK